MAARPLGADALEPDLIDGAGSRRVERQALQLGVRVGTGAEGEVYVVDDETVVKLFQHLPRAGGVALERLVAFRDGLDAEERERLDGCAAWPSELVVDGDRVIGYLMPEIPPPFWQRIETMSGPELIPREVQHLFVDESLGVRNLGETATAAERLALAESLAGAVALLHRHDLVFGDVSYRNEVYALRPEPAVLLVDCDAVRAEGHGAASPQLHSPGWKPPEGGRPSLASDRYKLGLFVLRCVTPGVNAQNRDPRTARHALSRDARHLLERSLSARPNERPPASAWVDVLHRQLGDLGGVPTRSVPSPDPAPPPRVTGPSPMGATRLAAGRTVTRASARAPRRATRQRPRVAAHPSPLLRKAPMKVRRPMPRRVHPSSVRSRRPSGAYVPLAAPSSPSPGSIWAWGEARRRITLVLVVIALLGAAFAIAFEVRRTIG